MCRKLFISAIVILLLIPSIFSGSVGIVAEANTGEDLKNQISELEKKRDELEKETGQTEEELQVVEQELNTTFSQMKKLDTEISETNDKITLKQAEIDESNKRISDLREDIVLLEKRIAERDAVLKERMNHMYKSGGLVSYMEVILGAQNFGDLIERVVAVNTIAQQDRNILNRHMEDKLAVEKATEDLEKALDNQESQMKDLQDLKDVIAGQRDEKQVLYNSLEGEKGELLELIVSMEEEEQIVKDQEAAVAKEIERWEEEQRRLEEERKRKEEEARRQAELEKQRQAEAAKAAEAVSNQQTETAGSGSSNSDNSSQSNTGIFHRPANGGITSGFGWRVHPIFGGNRFHNGVDFSGRSGTDIYAAESGTVSVVGYMGGYGNTVVITHVINGEPIHTLYAHLANSNVSIGQSVSKGQRIATMGTTGNSTGVHLHFEVRKGMGWNSAQIVNPMDYIN